MTHLIDRCPVEQIDVIGLADGQRVVLRPALEQDVQRHVAYFEGLSKKSRYNRFFNPTAKITGKMLEYLLHADHRSHVALMAECTSGNTQTVIAEARYKVVADRGSAEFALSVADQFHGLGLGKLLLDRLACAASHAGLAHLAGDTLAMNDKMLRLARKTGFTVTSDPQLLYVMRLEKRLGSAAQDAHVRTAA
jgi:GNAT superfamily N-acetyltransferase